MNELTELEIRIIGALGEVWNMYNKLPKLHNSDKADFLYTIHAAQNIVLARPQLREWQDRFGSDSVKDI